MEPPKVGTIFTFNAVYMYNLIVYSIEIQTGGRREKRSIRGR